MGQEVVKLKQWQKDQHKKEEMDEWKKEKEEQKREKERVLRELARDRAEKAAKYYAEKVSEKKPASDGKAIEVKKPANVDETKQEDNDQLMEQLIKLRAERSAQYHRATDDKEKKLKESEKRKAEAQSEAETKKQRGCVELQDQLRWDREEKKAKFQAQKEERAKTLEEVRQKKLQTEKSAREKSEAAKMEHAHLQFRLPDGSAITNQFSSQDTLQVARDFLSAKIGNSFGNFHLTTTYPKRRFRDDDLPRTLLDLELAPSAVIVVIPDSSRTVSRRGDSGTSNLLMTLLAPLLIVWNFLYALVFGTASEPRGAYNPVRTSQTPSTASASETVQRSQGRERPKSSYGLRRRQEGNMMRLSAVRDEDDDDTATWNGNSTQQM
ncbi:hypothetical protein LSH36_141g10079 [Paralvinella palmiformis]|uniref:UBX domain-containing protein 4 n=1 Tax=Paralvinella palmiformis TaxID=53620 RepID=A0AAD9N9K7_9ANNE|nr:hypothetical protein LSH36_141g10079 [Paralvinella palmiformis]